MIHSLRKFAFEHPRLDFDNESSMDNEDYKVLTWYSRASFRILFQQLQVSTHQKVAAGEHVLPFLWNYDSLSNKMLAVLFDMTKYQVNQKSK